MNSPKKTQWSLVSNPLNDGMILLMVQKSGDHHLGCFTPPVNNGIKPTYPNLFSRQISEPSTVGVTVQISLSKMVQASGFPVSISRKTYSLYRWVFLIFRYYFNVWWKLRPPNKKKHRLRGYGNSSNLCHLWSLPLHLLRQRREPFCILPRRRPLNF